MSNDTKVAEGTRTNFASRLLNKTMSERKKTEEAPLTTAAAAIYAQSQEEKQSQEAKETVAVG
jgi:hypothetical protein